MRSPSWQIQGKLEYRGKYGSPPLPFGDPVEFPGFRECVCSRKQDRFFSTSTVGITSPQSSVCNTNKSSSLRTTFARSWSSTNIHGCSGRRNSFPSLAVIVPGAGAAIQLSSWGAGVHPTDDGDKQISSPIPGQHESHVRFFSETTFDYNLNGNGAGFMYDPQRFHKSNSTDYPQRKGSGSSILRRWS